MPEGGRVLVVDDEDGIREMICEYLSLHGLDVEAADGGPAMRAALARQPVDLVILDVRMPGEDGLSLARWLREHQDTGIVMLTAAGDTLDRIVGLEVGADDYLPKPFEPRELLARVRNVLQRIRPPVPTATEARGGAVRFGRCMLDLDARTLHTLEDRQEVPITPTEFELLRAFATNPDRPLSREQLAQLAHDRELDALDRSIDTQIWRLRRKVEPNPEHPAVIKTVRGAGYMFGSGAFAVEPPIGPKIETVPPTGRDALARAMVEAALDAVIVADERGVVREFSPAAERIFGYGREEVLGRSLAEVVVPLHLRAAHAAGMARVVATGEVRLLGRRTETTGLRADGSTFPVELTLASASVEGERLFVAYLRDITERQRAEEALRTSEQRLRTVVEGHPVPMTVTRLADCRLLFANRAFLTAFGIEPGELDSFDHSRLFAGGPEERQALFARLAAEGEIEGQEIDMRRADGTPFPAFATARVVDYQGSLCSVASFLDLSALKTAEREIARQREALHQQEKLSALGSLLAGVAHELNNPLAIVVGRAAMLEEVVSEARVRASLTKVRDAAERCARIVKSFLAMARQKPSERRPVAVERLLDTAVEMVAYGARSSGIEVERRIDPDLPPVLADEDQLHQVFANLLVNAQQALRDVPPPRRIVLNAALEKDGRTVRVDVADTGPGVPPAIRGRIFDPFFTTKPVGQGTGIGLSICHAIVTAHGGTTELGERAGGGALFVIRLPAAPLLAGAEDRAFPAFEAPLPAARVLVVDDEPEVCEMIEEILRDEGHAVAVAADGGEALRRLEQERFDLVITDLRMPGMDGRELYASLCQRDPVLATRTILLTGDALGLDPSRFPGLEADALLEKPALPEAVRRVVRHKLGGAVPPRPA